MKNFNHRKKFSAGHIIANTHLCKACWDCVAACPNKVIGKVGFLWHKHIVIANASACTGCLRCVKACGCGVFSEAGGQPS